MLNILQPCKYLKFGQIWISEFGQVTLKCSKIIFPNFTTKNIELHDICSTANTMDSPFNSFYLKFKENMGEILTSRK